MIIEFSDEFSGFDNGDWVPYLGAIEHLITAHANGWHILAPPRAVAASIETHCGLSGRQSALFKASVTSRIANLVGQAKTSDHTMLAIPTGSKSNTVRNNQQLVDLAHFNKMSACLPTQLLTEDANHDGRYFKFLATVLSKELGYGMRIKLDLVHGGGAGVAARYQELKDSDRFGICVVDSDRRYPEGPLGNTAKGVNEFGLNNDIGTVRAFILPVREVENTIPISFLYEVYRDSETVRRRVSVISDYLAKVKKGDFRNNVLAYLDLKEGDKIGKVAAIPNPHKEDIVAACRAVSQRNLTIDQFDDLACDDKAHDGISVNVLRSTLNYLQETPRHDRLFSRKMKNAPFWKDIEPSVRLILAYGAGDVALPSR